MNFSEFISTMPGIKEEITELVVAKISWNECKSNILNILRQNIIDIEGPYGTGREYVDIDVIKEIEKL